MKIFKRLISLLLAVLLAGTAGCSVSAHYRDGVYSAQMDEFSSSGWKDTVELTIENGKIVKISWDAIYEDDSIPIRKKQYSKSGLYGMLAAGSSGEWCDQAAAAEQYVLEHGVEALAVRTDGYTDAVSSCTIQVSNFDRLVRECLNQAAK